MRTLLVCSCFVWFVLLVSTVVFAVSPPAQPPKRTAGHEHINGHSSRYTAKNKNHKGGPQSKKLGPIKGYQGNVSK